MGPWQSYNSKVINSNHVICIAIDRPEGPHLSMLIYSIYIVFFLSITSPCPDRLVPVLVPDILWSQSWSRSRTQPGPSLWLVIFLVPPLHKLLLKQKLLFYQTWRFKQTKSKSSRPNTLDSTDLTKANRHARVFYLLKPVSSSPAEALARTTICPDSFGITISLAT